MNILVTLNKNYLDQLIVLLYSINKSNPDVDFNLYIISKEVKEVDILYIKSKLTTTNYQFHLINFDDSLLTDAPTSSRYPLEIYYRIFAAKVLPKDVKKVLYLDPDIVVINSLKELYDLDFDNNYFIGATHIRRALTDFNRLRVNQKEKAPYINTGVMMMNIEELRNNQTIDEVYNFINKYKLLLTLPDQDVIFALYGHKIKLVDFLIYNLSDRCLKKYNRINKLNLDTSWVRDNSVVVHYCGRNKPWKDKYRGELNIFYNEMVNELKYMKK